MQRREQTRRSFLQKSAGIAAASIAAPYIFTSSDLQAAEPKSKNDRPVFGCIGLGNMGLLYDGNSKGATGISDSSGAARFGTVVAVCDVDRKRAENGSDGGKRAVYQDYRKLLDRKDIEAVTISTPDHWHTKIAIDAMRAGKDVHCQKPLTLTIDEGKKICKVVKETGRVFQVGTQQRSTSDLFLTAVAMCHLGMIGKIHRVTCAVGGRAPGGPFKKTTPPAELDWEVWQGQAPKTEYIQERTHEKFRGWFEYAGGEMTDWGAHHVDIAQWAIGMDHTGPLTVEPVSYKLPVPYEKGYAKVDDCYNVPSEFLVKCQFPNGVEMVIRHDTDNGILFEGEKGRFFVNRGKLVGKPVEAMAGKPIPEDVLTKLRKGKPSFAEAGNPWASHMANFVACIKDRSTPISDVFTHHRIITTCHLANIAIRLGRKLHWNAETEQIVGDDEANAFLSRPQRKGYEIEA
jgi:predicted dehydrogenase